MSNFFEHCILEKQKALPNNILILLKNFSQVFNNRLSSHIINNSAFDAIDYINMINLEVSFVQLSGQHGKNFKSNSVVEFNTLYDNVLLESICDGRQLSIMLNESANLRNEKLYKIDNNVIIEFTVELLKDVIYEVKISMSEMIYGQYLTRIYLIMTTSDLNFIHQSVCAIGKILKDVANV